jgi:hypothetical protein
MNVNQRLDDGAGVAGSWTAAAAAAVGGTATWLAAVAPGIFLTCSLVLLALILAPWVISAVYVAAAARAVAAGMLLVHIAATVLTLSRSGLRSVALLLALLAADALLAGTVIAADTSLLGPGAAIALLVLMLGFEAAGWMGALGGVAFVAIGIGGASFTAGGPLLLMSHWSFPTALSVETSFAGVSAGPTAAPVFPTALSVETFFAGVPVARAPADGFPTALMIETSFAGAPTSGSSGALFVPALGIVLTALCVGGAVNLLRLRRRCPEVRG